MTDVLIKRELLEQAAWMELDTTTRSIRIQDELRAILAQPTQQGEAVEVVGWLGGNGLHADRHDATGAPFPLMTVAQHQRITAAMAADVELWERSFRDIHEPALRDAHAYIQELRAENERLTMQLTACGAVALSNTPDSAAKARDMHPDYMSASCSDVMRAVDREMHQRAALLDWAVERWHAEVSQRPLVNVNRRSIDDAWRQIIRKLGGDPVDLCGPDHDTLLASAEGVKDE